MNYRHAFHAGNHCDVVKHVLLARLIERLKVKDKPFRVFDTHAGRGIYDLGSSEALRTGEAKDGIHRLLAFQETWDRDLHFRAYHEAVAPDLAENRYPGSPLLTRRLLRSGDRLSAYELHPDDAKDLKRLFAGDVAVKVIELDGWLALGAHLPPKERRGLVFIDPPFEKPSELDDILSALAKAFRRWRDGIYAVWYPLKRRELSETLVERLSTISPGEAIVAELLVESYAAEPALVGSGFFVANPPFRFDEEADSALRTLLPILKRGDGATARVFDPRSSAGKLEQSRL